MVSPVTDLWRLIVHPPSAGSWNMAVDEALLESAIAGDQPPTLRLFSWDPACLSIGYAQPISEVDLDLVARSGYSYVRRPTGGRAILHIDELTYSVTAPLSHPLMDGGILPSYQRISSAFIRFLDDLGLKASAKEMIPSNGIQPPEAICFEVPSNYEITIEGKKIIGSAQARRKTGVLQHGSIPLFGDIGRITTVLSYPSELNRNSAYERVKSRAMTIQDALGRKLTIESAADRLIQAFQDSLGVNFSRMELTDVELENAREIQKNKYAHSAWNERI